jgi:Bacterial protein of unknown function (DUF885)
VKTQASLTGLLAWFLLLFGAPLSANSPASVQERLAEQSALFDEYYESRLQLSAAQKLSGLPKFRRHGGNSGYIEGWTPYAEQIGKEVGFYQFDIKSFHDEMLNGGVLPLDLLDARTNDWIQEQKHQRAASSFCPSPVRPCTSSTSTTTCSSSTAQIRSRN